MKKLSLLILVIFAFTSCNKEGVKIDDSISFSDVKTQFYSDIIVIIEYDVTVEGNPIFRESGTIITVDPEVSYFNHKVKNEEEFKENVSINLSVEAETQYYVRPYVITFEDTVYGDVQSFMSGSYFKDGNGVSDASGNNYETIILGNQEWMAENLKSSQYCNGDSIPFSVNDTIYFERYNEAQSVYYDYDTSNFNTYGMMYSGYAILDSRNICPCGWSVPTSYDWDELFTYLGNNKFVGGKMKSTGVLEDGTGLWESPNGLANNLSGFTALPGGYQVSPSSFYGKNSYGNFTFINANESQPFVQMISIDYIRGQIHVLNNNNSSGMYVRCIKDA
ncbi:fibrobacter succinogenes major paralogous domain-containing protein [Brumimicrobium mesophilum]|uniref:fibrobacter succinogenes major paralogous domain-containing protein n=1 Tax=Brumimicrobium mesophilum TaxID=392717 RepID=UPI00131A7325|nr:fibrobacter succinogenes major paralogous domain-containing protein [Brumimicrobium mesophilum]